MLHIRLSVPAALTQDVLDIVQSDPAISALSIDRGGSLKPLGDVIDADCAREATNEIIEQLLALGVHRLGTLRVDPVSTWVSADGYEAETRAPGSGADSVVWSQVTQRAYEDAELNWTYVSFITMATLLAGIAIIVDSQILTVGAMVLSPEFGAIAALGLALVRHRWTLFGLAMRSLVLGFSIAIVITTLAALVVRGLGWVTVDAVTGSRSATAFIYHPNRWSLVVAVIAAAAGVLSLTSSKVGGLSGVFISVTTVPAAGNVGLALAFGVWDEVRGSAIQLLVNVTGMAVAGWLTLRFQQLVWSRISTYRESRMGRRHRRRHHDRPRGQRRPPAR